MPSLGRVVGELRAEKVRASFDAAALCFPEQLAPIVSIARRKVLRCGRRSGKTMGVAIALLQAAQRPPAVPVLYVTLTRENAREIIWGDLLELNERFQLGGKVNQSRLTIKMPSGCQVQLRGAHTEAETKKYRGKKFKLAIVDEAQSFPDRVLSPLLKDIIGPTLIDHSGDLWLVGTPPPLRRGVFFESYGGKLRKGREVHHWTIAQNTMLPARIAGRTVDEILAEVREEYGWNEEDPTFLREYLGEDREDREALLYQYLAGRNTYTARPDGTWSYVFGIDIGYDDSDAIAVLGWRRGDNRVFLVDEHVKAEEDITDLAGHIKRMRDKYHPIKMVIDEGGGGKKSAAELRRRHALPLEAAEKAQKATWIKLLNADMRKGLVLAQAESRWVDDCGLVRKDPEALARGVLQELAAAKGGYHSDITDAVLYGWRAAYGWAERDIPPPPTAEQRMDAHEAKEAAAVERRKSREWWDDGGGDGGVFG